MTTLAEKLEQQSTFARSSRSGVFPAEQVRAMADKLDRVPIVATLEKWRELDAGPNRHPGGRPATLNFRALLVVMLLVMTEHAPFAVTEFSNVFWRRLDDESRALLDIAGVRITDKHSDEATFWYKRTDRLEKAMYALMDPDPMPRQIMNAGERRYQHALIDPEVAQVKRARLHWFLNQLLEMTLHDLPEEVLGGWDGSVSVDRTKIPAANGRGRPAWRKKAGKRIGPEPDALIMESHADWYMHKPEFRAGDDPNEMDGTWGFPANIAVMVQSDPTLAPRHPLLAVAYSLGVPNNDDISEDTIALLASLRERGHPAGRVTGDKEYFSIQMPERLALPAKALGYSPMFDYRSTELGAVGQIGGAIQVEGRLFCPSMPTGLRDATKLFNTGKITEAVYRERIEEERPLWEVRVKERPDADGAYPIMCPAYGAGATIDCPLRALHAKVSKRETRPEAVPPPEHKRDRICTQTSVNVAPDAATRYLQEYRYGSRAWRSRYGHDRSQIESYNSAIKDRAKEDIENTARRRRRGFTAAAVAVGFAIVSANLRMTNAWYRAEALRRAEPEKPYKRKTKPFTKVSLETYLPRLPQMDEKGTITLPPPRPKKEEEKAA